MEFVKKSTEWLINYDVIYFIIYKYVKLTTITTVQLRKT